MRTLTKEEFIERVNKIWDHKYDYSKVIYVNKYTKVEIICKEHGSFFAQPNNHYRTGCAECTRQNLAYSLEDFIKLCNEAHGNKYDYSLITEYKNNKKQIRIICPVHGEFSQQAKTHMKGIFGCRKCYFENPKYNTDSQVFIDRCISVFDDLYDYSLVEYKGMDKKVKIICKKHGIFTNYAQSIINGIGCQKCSRSISKKETAWLDYLGIPNNECNRNYNLKIDNRKFKCDGYCNGIVYEFYGDYWHGNPEIYDQLNMNKSVSKTFGILYKNTIERENIIKSYGYKIISIWESEWNKIAKKLKEIKMPCYEHVCTNEECKHEWEDEYSILQPPPTTCPKCGQETAKRLISLNGKGVVELFGQDLIDKVKVDAKKLEQDAHSNENTYANLLGNDRFHRLQTNYDRRKK